MAIPKFVISKSRNNQFYFNLFASNGKVITTSEMYISKQGCENGIAAVKRDAPVAKVEDTTT
ncbi:MULTISPECIES: YegP family protein [Flavobacteriaceae]|uniref:YegP family protein n=1 Tax=Flavobacteriaceae TaxID=49546 RepID=UPI00234B4FAF|nr:YegP family protein [Muricauda sp. SP22]MDC6364002.1 YegP family protein [Muricauda sp. SP22]